MQYLLLQGLNLCNSLPPAVQAKEFGEAEVWMNERLMRAAPHQFAEFVTAFEDRDALARRGAEPLWLVTLYPRNQSDFDRDALARRGAEPLWLVTLYPSNQSDFDRDALAWLGAEPLWLVTLYPSNRFDFDRDALARRGAEPLWLVTHALATMLLLQTPTCMRHAVWWVVTGAADAHAGPRCSGLWPSQVIPGQRNTVQGLQVPGQRVCRHTCMLRFSRCLRNDP